MVEKTVKRQGFCALVRRNFIDLVEQHDSTNFAQQHLTTIKRSSMRLFQSTATCGVCLIRPPCYTLDCRHRLCRPCTIVCGQETDSWEYHVPHCPLCQISMEAVFKLKPSTAGTRLLSLDGINQDSLWQFVKELAQGVNLVSIPLSHHFDGVVAADFGTYCSRSLPLIS